MLVEMENINNYKYCINQKTQIYWLKLYMRFIISLVYRRLLINNGVVPFYRCG